MVFLSGAAPSGAPQRGGSRVPEKPKSDPFGSHVVAPRPLERDRALLDRPFPRVLGFAIVLPSCNSLGLVSESVLSV
jgi:hypothetical protein